MPELLGWLTNRRKPDRSLPLTVALEDKKSTPNIREIDERHSFQENQRDTLQIHKEEIPNFVKDPSVVIVKIACRELSNGNLAAQLDSFTDLQIDGNELEVVIVVNNPRIMAILFELRIDITTSPQEISRQLRSYYEQHKISLSEYEEDFLKNLDEGKKNLERILSTYTENQASLAVLKLLSFLVVKIQEGAIEEAEALEEVNKSIPLLVEGILDESQLKLLIQVAKRVLKRKIVILGIDCSSREKAYEKVDLSQATNQGCHIGVARGAHYLDISDMDQFYSREGLNEIVQLSKTKNPDVLYRPLKLVTPQHPEQFKNVGWDTLSYYYASSALRREHEWKYAYYKPEEDSDAVHNTGHIVISTHAFEKHQYLHDDWFQDLVFSRKMQTDPTLSQYQLLDSDLLLSNRGREESYDGSRYSRDKKPADMHAQIEGDSLRLIHQWIERDKQIFDFLHKEPVLLDLLKDYELQKALFLRLQNKERRALRYVFLSSEGLIPKLFQVLSSPKDITDDDLEKLNLTTQQKIFIRNNPALIPALRKEIIDRQIASSNELTAIMESSLPEFFHLPIVPEDLSLPNTDNSGDLDKELSQRGLVNTSLWIHLFKSRQWLASRVTNEVNASTYPANMNVKLDQLLKLLTRLGI